MMRRISWAVVHLSLITASALLAQGPPTLGVEFQVNTHTTDMQRASQVAVAADGAFVVVWQSRLQDGDSGGVFGQRHGSDGSELGGEFQVNTYTTYNQNYLGVASAADGDFVVVWQSYYQDGDIQGVFARRYSSDGTSLGGEFQVNTNTTGVQTSPAVAAAANGDFVVVWSSDYEDGDFDGVMAQRFASDGNSQGGQFQVNTFTTGLQYLPSVSAAANGDFVVAWQSYYLIGYPTIQGQRYASSGAAMGGQFAVSSVFTGTSFSPSIASADNGAFMAVWEFWDISETEVHGRVFDASGTAIGDQFQVNSVTTVGSYSPVVAATSGGSFIVSWANSEEDGDSGGVLARRVDADGSTVGSDFQVNTYTTDRQTRPAVAGGPYGQFTVVWDSNLQDGSAEGVFSQRFGELALFADGFESGDTTAW